MQLYSPIGICCLTVFMASSAHGDPRSEIDGIVSRYMAQEHVPGVAVVAIQGDEVVLAHGWGFANVATREAMTPDVMQPIYSISKHITAALVLSLAEEGLLDTQDAVGHHLPEWFADEPALQLTHLLRHTSGLAEFIGLDGIEAIENGSLHGSIEDVLDRVDRTPRRFAPGTWHAYSNSNYSALALIAERAGGAQFGTQLQRRLFARLGSGALVECATSRERGDHWSTGYTLEGKPWTPPPNLTATFQGNGGICATARTLALWMQALATGRVLSTRRVEELVSTAAVSNGFTPPYGYGLSTQPVAGRRAWSHAGGGEGWGAWAAYLPDDQLTVVIVANRGVLWSTDLGQPIVRALLGVSPPPLRRQPLDVSERRALTGRCNDGLFDIHLRAERRRVIVDIQPFGEPIELWKQSPGLFVAARRPDTFKLALAGETLTLDWMEHRSYLRSCTRVE